MRSSRHLKADTLLIRPATAADAPVLYDICLRTGLAGSDASAAYLDPDLLGHVYVGPYLALAPDLAFVLVGDDDIPAGYVLGAADTVEFHAACEAGWWPPLRERYPVRLAEQSPGTPDARLILLIHAPSPPPAGAFEAFPAHLHVDLLPSAQGSGHGRRLLEHLFTALRGRGAPGLHLGASALNTRAIGFYRHLRFVTLEVDEAGALLGLELR